MNKKLLFALVAGLLAVSMADAGWRRGRRGGACDPCDPCPTMCDPCPPKCERTVCGQIPERPKCEKQITVSLQPRLVKTISYEWECDNACETNCC